MREGVRPTDDRRLFRLLGTALPLAVWLLGFFSPQRGQQATEDLVAFTALLAALAALDYAAPGPGASVGRRLAWVGGELVLAFLVVEAHGSLVRPSLVYLLPAGRAVLLFGERRGFVVSLSVWAAFATNIGLDVLPDRPGEYPNYLAFLLGPYVVVIVLLVAVLRQASARRRLEALYEGLRSAHEQLQLMHEQARELAVTQERNRLAREIHDSVAHYLTVVNVQLEAAEKLGLSSTERALENVRRARRLTVACLQEVRRSVAALRAPTLDALSLPRALRRLSEEFMQSAGIPVDVRLDVPDELRFPPDTSLTLYRAAQEGLTNVQRHAQAHHVWIALSRANGTVVLAVIDDGVGPEEDVLAHDGQSGFGLLGLQERASLMGGSVSLARRSSTGGGELIVTLPFVEDSSAQ